MEHDPLEASHKGLDSLQQAYQRVQRPHKYFKAGRVFAVVWIEAAGPSLRDNIDHVTKVNYDQYAYTKPSRFVSVRNQKGFCVALRIHTFGGRGEEKYSTRPAHLFHVRSADDGVDLSHLEPNVVSIKVEDFNVTFAAGKSVVLASKPYSIEHFLPVRNIGHLERPSLAMLESALLDSFIKEPMQSKSSTKSSRATIKHARGGNKSDASESSEQMRSCQTDLAVGDEPGQGSYFCDCDPCPRRGLSFHKIDHLRDHLRDSHLEDIPRNRKFGNESKRAAWFASREVDKDWWRCKGCLWRVNNLEHGWLCPKCSQPCEPERIENRIQRYPRYYDEGFHLPTSVDPGLGVEAKEGGSSTG